MQEPSVVVGYFGENRGSLLSRLYTGPRAYCRLGPRTYVVVPSVLVGPRAVEYGLVSISIGPTHFKKSSEKIRFPFLLPCRV